MRSEVVRHGFANYKLQAELRLGELNLSRDHLTRVEQEAQAQGFLLIAHKARAALRAGSGS